MRTFTVPAGASDLAAGSAGAQDDATPAQNAAPVEAPVQQPVAVAGNVSAPAVEPIGPFRLATGALVALGLLASGIFYLVSHRRRRSRAYEQIVDLNVRTPLRTPPKIDDPKPSAPARAVRRRDQAEVDMERLREFSQAWKQRAA